MEKVELVFLKLGGSLITDKDRPRTPRLEVLSRMAAEIGEALGSSRPEAGDGAWLGVFWARGCAPVRHASGARSQADWMGFAEVWKEARALNQLVVEALHGAGLR
jgi:isopentenyl phosphate kinase